MFADDKSCWVSFSCGSTSVDIRLQGDPTVPGIFRRNIINRRHMDEMFHRLDCETSILISNPPPPILDVVGTNWLQD
ncbi:hypothetical protein QVD17_09274 [Tagetes erecta]|uniref:Uncharacterized protein n=1 Tax=Tagetes erecta TaxID=13708 RepID=A0AAD8P3T4_TARER|nr:hypothetical protein QVD17_09274 [Tagetes erecta]